MTIVAPERSHDQRLAALKVANDVRIVRAQVKRDIKAGDIEAWPLIKDAPTELEKMRVLDLLLAVPKLGRVKARRALVELRISESKTLAGMSDRQRDVLAGWLRRRG